LPTPTGKAREVCVVTARISISRRVVAPELMTVLPLIHWRLDKRERHVPAWVAYTWIGFGFLCATTALAFS